MDRIRNLTKVQKVFMATMLIMTLLFTVAYPITISRVGIEYNNAIFVPSEENNSTVYSGRVNGQKACFTVSADNTMVYQYGDKTYGPYKFNIDPTAIPNDHPAKSSMTGVEIWHGDDILFRGGIYESDSYQLLYNENGNMVIEYSVSVGSGVQHYIDGEQVDPAEPTASELWNLMHNPELTHKGDWAWWFGGVFICIINALLILYVDELFRWDLAFHIRNVYDAEPSDWEIVTRYIGWTSLIIVALICFYQGLTVVV